MWTFKSQAQPATTATTLRLWLDKGAETYWYYYDLEKIYLNIDIIKFFIDGMSTNH